MAGGVGETHFIIFTLGMKFGLMIVGCFIMKKKLIIKTKHSMSVGTRYEVAGNGLSCCSAQLHPLLEYLGSGHGIPPILASC